MSANLDCNSPMAQALPHLRAIVTIISGSRETADILIRRALSPYAGGSRELPKSHDLLSELIELARVHESTGREPVNTTEEPCVSLLHALPFSDRLAFVLVKIAGLSLVAASRICRKTPHEIQRCASDVANFLGSQQYDQGRRVANSGTPEYEFRS